MLKAYFLIRYADLLCAETMGKFLLFPVMSLMSDTVYVPYKYWIELHDLHNQYPQANPFPEDF